MNACCYFSILWSKTQVYFVSIKLFCNWFVQFTILWFYSSLKQTVQPELSYFMFYSQVKLFLLIFNRNWVEIVTNQNQSVYFRFFWMNDDLYCYWIHYRLFYTYSNPFAGFESTTVRAIRKYKFKKILVWTSYFDVFDITTSSGK